MPGADRRRALPGAGPRHKQARSADELGRRRGFDLRVPPVRLGRGARWWSGRRRCATAREDRDGNASHFPDGAPARRRGHPRPRARRRRGCGSGSPAGTGRAGAAATATARQVDLAVEEASVDERSLPARGDRPCRRIVRGNRGRGARRQPRQDAGRPSCSSRSSISPIRSALPETFIPCGRTRPEWLRR